MIIIRKLINIKMINNLKELRISNENRLQFQEKGWTLVDLKLPQKSINKAISGLKMMKYLSIKNNYKPRRIYYDHYFSNNLSAIELPFNKEICNKNIREFFKEAKIGSLVKNLMDWNNPCCDLARLFCMGNYKYRGNWHRDYESDLKDIQLNSQSRDVVLVGIYLLPQKGFRILKKDYEFNGKYSVIKNKKIDKFIRKFPFPLNPPKDSYETIDGTVGTALFFDPLLLHQGNNYASRLDFHMKFCNSVENEITKNSFQDFSVIDILGEDYFLNFENSCSGDIKLKEIPMTSRSSVLTRIINSFDYRTCIKRLFKVRSLKQNKNFKYIKDNGWELDYFSNTIFQK